MTYIIAEAGVNHNGNINFALEMVDKASLAGCDAIKFQTFKAERLVTSKAQKAQYQINNTHEHETQYAMLKRLELKYEDHLRIIKHCKERNIEFLSTPFDEESADMLESLGMNTFKIPSGEITNKPLLEHISKKSKPIILSTGMATIGEVEEALDWIYEMGNKNVILLHCTTDYPTQMIDVNLRAMLTLKNTFNVKIGYSDHTKGYEIPIAAVSLGAEVIEKHFTLDRNMDGPDHNASLEPDELKLMVDAIRNVELAFGNGLKKPTSNEFIMREYIRKSIVLKTSIKKDEILREDMITLKRPGIGMQPKEIGTILGKISKRDMFEGDLLKSDDFY